MKNLMGKRRTVDNPYETWHGIGDMTGWTWRVLKKYQGDDSKPYARWFCAVSSPFVTGYELGDVYAAEVMCCAVLSES